jgi:8-oxo-dGTP pyrophosphatase MutT (NUDIX family)
MKKYYAGGFLYNADAKSVLLHKRDGNTPYNPNKWSFFGGTNEDNENSPVLTFIRELKEELGISIRPDEVMHLTDYLNEKHNTHRYSFFVNSDIKKSEMTLGEGADFDWILIDHVLQLDLSPSSEKDLRLFISQL